MKIEMEIKTYWKCKICGHQQPTKENEEWPACPVHDILLDIRSSYQLHPME